MAEVKRESDLKEKHIAKRPKLNTSSEEKQQDVHSNIKDLSTFKVDKILNNNTKAKLVCLQGTFSNADGAALVLLEKTAFEEENLKSDSQYFSSSSCLKKIFHNDIYGNYEYYPDIQLNCKYSSDYP